MKPMILIAILATILSGSLWGQPAAKPAIQEQLGLRLDSQRGPVELIVIAPIEKPSEN